MHIQYFEIVTSDVDAACALYANLHGVTFGEAVPNLGGARTATMASGGVVGVRAPMRADEAPTTRAYTLVEDIEAAVDGATEGGAEVAIRAMELPGHGTCAIVIQGGSEFGFWQL